MTCGARPFGLSGFHNRFRWQAAQVDRVGALGRGERESWPKPESRSNWPRTPPVDLAVTEDRCGVFNDLRGAASPAPVFGHSSLEADVSFCYVTIGNFSKADSSLWIRRGIRIFLRIQPHSVFYDVINAAGATAAPKLASRRYISNCHDVTREFLGRAALTSPSRG